MSTPQDPEADPSARIEMDAIEELEAQLRDETSSVSAQEQVVEAFLE